jgi:hypothetical protein
MKTEFENLSSVGQVVSTYSMRLNKVTGFFNGSTATRWLQLHDAKAIPSGGGTVAPLRSWPLYVTAPFEQEFSADPIELVNGCVLVVSTTQTTFTTSVDTMSLFVNGTSHLDFSGVTAVGDYTTGAASRTIWATGTANKLVRLEVTKLSNPGTSVYLKLFAKSPASGNKPFFQKVIANGDSFDGFFLTDLEQTFSNTDYNGCYVAIDATTGAYAGDYAGTDFAIKGTYK